MFLPREQHTVETDESIERIRERLESLVERPRRLRNPYYRGRGKAYQGHVSPRGYEITRIRDPEGPLGGFLPDYGLWTKSKGNFHNGATGTRIDFTVEISRTFNVLTLCMMVPLSFLFGVSFSTVGIVSVITRDNVWPGGVIAFGLGVLFLAAGAMVGTLIPKSMRILLERERHALMGVFKLEA